MSQLTRTKEELLLTLTHRLPLLTLTQAVRLGIEKSDLDSLTQERLLERLWFTAHPEISLGGPAVVWMPSSELPKFGPIAYRLKARWNKAAVGHEIVIASKRAKHLFGGYLGGKPPRRSELTHDIHLAQVYLRFREQQPELALNWEPEAKLLSMAQSERCRVPDATIVDPKTGTPRLLVEFGGAYGKQKLEAFHAACSDIPYQIW